MTGMKAIIKKEWLCYFYSPLAYVVIGLFALIMGIIFDVFIGIYQQANMPSPYGPSHQIPLDRLISQYFQNVAFILCFMTPMLTMRLFAEEKRQHTYELLFTAAPDRRAQVQQLEQDVGLMLTCIGRIEAERGVRLFNQGQPVANRWASFDHFKGAA